MPIRDSPLIQGPSITYMSLICRLIDSIPLKALYTLPLFYPWPALPMASYIYSITYYTYKVLGLGYITRVNQLDTPYRCLDTVPRYRHIESWIRKKGLLLALVYRYQGPYMRLGYYIYLMVLVRRFSSVCIQSLTLERPGVVLIYIYTYKSSYRR